MKTIISILLTLSLYVVETQAQFSTTIAAGVQRSSVNYIGDYQIDNSPSIYFYASVIPSYELNEKLSLSAGLSYSLIGFKEKINIEVNNRLGYIELAPHINYELINNFKIAFGFYTGYNTSEHFNISGEKWQATCKEDLYSNFQSGLTTGIQYAIGNIILSGEFQFGLTNLSNISFTDSSGNPIDNNYKLRNLRLGIGYRIDFSNKE